MVVLLRPFGWTCFFFQAEDGIRDAQESRGLGDVYKRQKVHSRANKPQPVKRTGFMHTHLSVSGCAFSLNIDFHDALPFLPKNIVEIYSNSDGKQEITYRSGSLVQAVSHSRAVRIK